MDSKKPSVSKAKSAQDWDRTSILESNFFAFVEQKRCFFDSVEEPQSVSKTLYLDLFESQLLSRHLDLVARQLKQQGLGYYTIASCGHEGNAAVSAVFRPTDMAFLHYRSAALMLQRAKSRPDIDMVRDILLSLLASTDDPISRGRHKVFGSVALTVPPQTSTIASHLPKAVGCAASIARAATLQLPSVLPQDSVVLCSLGDASINHASALCSLNTCRWIAHKRLPLPLVFVCEDNGLGVSVPVPDNWIESSVAPLPGIEYMQANGLDLDAVYQACLRADAIARTEKRPVFLHLKTVRLLGHAGNDFELGYRDVQSIQEAESRDPLLWSAAVIEKMGWLTRAQLLERYEAAKERVIKTLDTVANAPTWSSPTGIMASIVPPPLAHSRPAAIAKDRREKVFADKWKKTQQRLTLGQSINLALLDILLQYPNTIVFGEDVGVKGGVYGVTQGLQARLGVARVFDTLLDETNILGQAIGHAHNGFIPIPEIQFLAYLHNAEDQLRGEAATLSFFSDGQFTNPMVVRIASLGYQKGFGGHFHNDNSIAVLRDIPGLVIACPSNGADAVKMLRECVAMAHMQQRVVVFLEPIALYAQKDLHCAQDGEWLTPYPAVDETLVWGDMGYYPAQADNATVVVTYGNGVLLSRQAQARLNTVHGVAVSVLDLRWLAPLNEDAIVDLLQHTSRVVIVDECRRTGSLAEQLVTLLQQRCDSDLAIALVTAEDSFIPLGAAFEQVLPSVDDVVLAVLDLQQ